MQPSFVASEVRMFPNARIAVAAASIAGALVATGFAFHFHKTVLASSLASPAYTRTGELLPPADYREWIFLTSGIDMSYNPRSAGTPDHSMFDNVFVNREAYRSFQETGTWPDKTMMVLESREAGSKGSINQRGHFQTGEVMGFEVHVKDEARFPDKWAFFSFDSPSGNGTLIPTGAPCYSCHAARAAVDTTFVQFYPTLLPVATKKSTLSAEFLKDQAALGAGK